MAQTSVVSNMQWLTRTIVALEIKNHWTVFLELNVCKACVEDLKVRNPGFS